MLTDEELRAIAERTEAATPGPWCGEFSLTDWKQNESTFSMEFIDNRCATEAQRDADLAFMAAARSDVPRLLADLHCYRDFCRRLVACASRERTSGIKTIYDPDLVALAEEVRAALEGK